MGAAKKVMTQIKKKHSLTGRVVLAVTVQETTKGSSKKEFSYTITRRHEPTEVNGVVHEWVINAKSRQ